MSTEYLEGLIEELTSKVDDLESQLKKIKRNIPDDASDAIKKINSRLDDIESRVDDLENP